MYIKCLVSFDKISNFEGDNTFEYTINYLVNCEKDGFKSVPNFLYEYSLILTSRFGQSQYMIYDNDKYFIFLNIIYWFLFRLNERKFWIIFNSRVYPNQIG